MLATLRAYYYLTKPGIVRGNLIAAAAGFFLAAQGSIDAGLLLALLAGTAAIIAAACVCNNYLDRDIDARMDRTKRRALVTHRISNRAAILYAIFLGVTGFTILGLFINTLTVLVGLVGVVFYVIVYGYAKRTTHHGTLIGSISGSTPPVAGYVAVTGSIDTAAVLLFFVLTFWQMPHFYAIAIFRKADYAAARIPVLPITKGIRRTQIEIIFYMFAFLMAALALTFTGYTGWIYAVIMIALSAWWLATAFKSQRNLSVEAWATSIFKQSLVTLLAFCVLVSLSFVLPY